MLCACVEGSLETLTDLGSFFFWKILGYLGKKINNSFGRFERLTDYGKVLIFLGKRE